MCNQLSFINKFGSFCAAKEKVNSPIVSLTVFVEGEGISEKVGFMMSSHKKQEESKRAS